MTEFQKAILIVVSSIPKGKVASYGQVAAYIGTPRAARQVGWAMSTMGDIPDFPWWRVLNNAGKITIKGNFFNSARLQKELLEAEGIVVNNQYELDITVYRFRANDALLRKFKLDQEYIEDLLIKYGIG